MKCWLFYCLGSGDWDLSDAVDKRYQEVARNLEPVLVELLPEPLRRYEQINDLRFATYLRDPLTFAYKMETALDNILATPLFELYGHQVSQRLGESMEEGVENKGINLEALLVEEGISRVITEIMAQIEFRTEIDIGTDQILADLERLEWIALGRPSNGIELLEEMETRYCGTNKVEEDPVFYSIGILIKRLRNKLLLREGKPDPLVKR
jgi:hypothetical protein